MKVGDKIIYVNKNKHTCYTTDKHYTIYEISKDFIPGRIVGYIKDDTGQRVYFRDDDFDPNWKNLKTDRKEKLNKLNVL